MGFTFFLGEALNFVQLMGFTVENARLMKGITAVTGVGQVLLALFGVGDKGDDRTASIVISEGNRILSAIDDLELEIGADIKAAFHEEHIAGLAAAQDQLKLAIDLFLSMDAPDTGHSAEDNILSRGFENWRNSITDPVVINSNSSVVQTIEWAQQRANQENDYATFSLYLAALGLYLNYCKLGIGLEYHEMCMAWSAAQAESPSDAPPPNQSDLKQGIYYRALSHAFETHLAFVTPKVEAIVHGKQERDKNVASSGDLNTLHVALARGLFFHGATAKHHLKYFVEDKPVELLQEWHKTLKAAQSTWDDDLMF